MYRKPSVWQLFLSFLRLGLTAFGGPAMVAYIKELSVNKKQWIDEESFNQGVALCQTIPGAIAVNMASYVGLRARGIIGMLTCFAGFILPAFFLLLAFSAVYYKSRALPAMVSLFTGLQIIVVAIIAHAAFTFSKNTLRERPDFFLAGISLVALLLKTNAFVIIVAAASAGIVFYRIRGLNIRSDSSKALDPQKVFGFLGYRSKHLKNSLMLIVCYLVGVSLLFFADKILFRLAIVMSKIELFAFGGGYTALTLMFHEVVETMRWLDSKTFMDGVALGQVTPGPILINATFVGYLLKGATGAVVGTISIFAPGLILINTILPVFDRLSSSVIFLRAIRGIVTCFVGLLLFITAKFVLTVQWDMVGVLFGLAALVALIKKVDVLYVVLISAAVSVFVF